MVEAECSASTFCGLAASLTLAVFQALLAEGIERGYAIELTGNTCWKIYAQWGRSPA